MQENKELKQYETKYICFWSESYTHTQRVFILPHPPPTLVRGESQLCQGSLIEKKKKNTHNNTVNALNSSSVNHIAYRSPKKSLGGTNLNQ